MTDTILEVHNFTIGVREGSSEAGVQQETLNEVIMNSIHAMMELQNIEHEMSSRN